MDFNLRFLVDHTYPLVKTALFLATHNDPERAHEHLVKASKFLTGMGLDEFLLGQPKRGNQNYELSNAAGFNKNGDIPPTFLRSLGFDRVVVGTVTGEPWEGKPRPRIRRYSATGSMVNWMGLPGVGAQEVAETMNDYGDHHIPITINLMATPGKSGDDAIKDLEKTVLATRDLPM